MTTTMHFGVPPSLLFRSMMFYEDVPGRPSWLLSIFLPRPLRSVGDKTRVGAQIRCDYERGHLIKEMTRVEPPHSLQFTVLEQHLGVEHVITALEGSYVIQSIGDGCEVRLATHYRGHGRPRWLWRSIERFFVHALHRHILCGLRDVASRKDCGEAAE